MGGEAQLLMPAKKPKTQQEWAEYYNWAYSLLKSDNSLWKVFQQAIKGSWSKEKFIAEIRRTSWYQKHSETYRQTEALKYTDPETWRARVRTIYNNVTQLAGTMGLRLGWQTMWDMAEDALSFGWDNAKLRSMLSQHLKNGKGGYYGEAGEAEDQLRQYAFQMGVRIDESALGGWLKGILNGTRTTEDYKGWLQQQALSAFPTLSEQIKGGMSVRDIASPYMEAMGRILEVDSQALDLYDPTIRTALTNINKENGKAELKPLWQFENELRKDPRWLKTNNARQAMNSTARTIGQQFGMVF
ncbi:hypothetical protein AB0C33_01905 [Nonomuraea sp. NPDC048881]|uniref:hypothetical protein n=1 Tax=Nonomuraea sp. NPDC048881 TaxID=3155030 RepID=UPI0033C5A5AD